MEEKFGKKIVILEKNVGNEDLKSDSKNKNSGKHNHSPTMQRNLRDQGQGQVKTR